MPIRRKEFVVCIRNKGYEASLERRKIYEAIPDKEAAKHRQLRIVDESGDDYLYPDAYFARIDVPQTLRRALVAGR